MNVELVSEWEESGNRIAIAAKDLYQEGDQSTGITFDIFYKSNLNELLADSENGEIPTPLLILHGFPTSSFDFHKVLPLLKSQGYVIHDHLGFGHSEKPTSHLYSLKTQARIAIEVWKKLGITKGHLIAHDYGTSVATEILALREEGLCPISLQSVTLSNGSMLIELAKLRPIQKILRNSIFGPIAARFASFNLFRRNMTKIWGDSSKLDTKELKFHWKLMLSGGGRNVMSPISKYTYERTTFRARWIGALNRCELPVHLLWASLDPIALPIIAETIARQTPTASLTWLHEVGHYPMLEAPELWAKKVLDYLEPLN